MLLVPVGGPGDELAVGIALDDLEHGDGRQHAGPLELAAGARDQPVVGHIAQQLFQSDAVAAFDAEGARDLALAGFAARGCRKSRISCLEGSLPAFCGFGSVLGLGHACFLARAGQLACRLLDGLFLFLASCAALLALRAGFFCRALGGSRGDQLDRLVHRDLFGFAVLGQAWR